MRTIIRKLFFAVGILVSTFWMASSADAHISLIPTAIPSSLKVSNGSEKLYFADAIKGSIAQQYPGHYSHSSHSSHSSHRSHYSHVSSRY